MIATGDDALFPLPDDERGGGEVTRVRALKKLAAELARGAGRLGWLNKEDPPNISANTSSTLAARCCCLLNIFGGKFRDAPNALVASREEPTTV